MSIQWLLLSHAIARSLAAECVLDSELYNPGIFPTLAEDFPAAIVAPLCGRNRGAFATDPPDGHTYSCVTFPGTNGTWGGAAVKDANAIKTLYDAGKLSDDAAVGVLDAFVRSVYASGDKNHDDPGACEVNGMAKPRATTRPTRRAPVGRALAARRSARHARRRARRRAVRGRADVRSRRLCGDGRARAQRVKIPVDASRPRHRDHVGAHSLVAADARLGVPSPSSTTPTPTTPRCSTP